MDESRGVGRSHMVGAAHVGTGELAHEWAHQLRALVDLEDDGGRPLTVTVPEPLTTHGQRLADSLGVRVEVRPVSPLIDVQAATSSQDCLQPGCPQEAESGRTHCRHHRRLGEPVVLAERRVEERPAAPAPQPAVRKAAPPRRRAASGWTRETIIEAIHAHAREHGYPPVAGDWVLRDDRRPSRGDVKRVFGSWADAVEAAGFPRPRRGVSARFLKDSSSDTTSEERADRRLGPEAARSSDAEEAPPVEAGQPEQRVRPEGASGQHRVTGGLPEPAPTVLDLEGVRAAALQAVNAIFDLLERVEEALA